MDNTEMTITQEIRAAAFDPLREDITIDDQTMVLENL